MRVSAGTANRREWGRSLIRVMRILGYHGHLGMKYEWSDREHGNDVDNLLETILLRDLVSGR